MSSQWTTLTMCSDVRVTCNPMPLKNTESKSLRLLPLGWLEVMPLEVFTEKISARRPHEQETELRRESVVHTLVRNSVSSLPVRISAGGFSKGRCLLLCSLLRCCLYRPAVCCCAASAAAEHRWNCGKPSCCSSNFTKI